MLEQLDYYECLDVEKTANMGEIRKSFISLALKWHPDKNNIGKKRAEKAFIEICEAFAVVYDEELRAVYDSLGSEEVKKVCTKYDLQNFNLDQALAVFATVYKNRDPLKACMEDDNWYENNELFTGGLGKSLSHERFRNKLDVETEYIETSMSRFATSPKNMEKSVKSVIIERDGRRVKKTITTVTRADGSQEIVEEEKEEPISRITRTKLV